MFETKQCEPCGREFIESSCPEHCGPACCRRQACSNARPAARNPAAKYRTCIVCGRSNARFPWERFAACDDGCTSLTFRGRQGTGATKMRVRYCQGVWMPGMEHLHHPKAKPRLHLQYCSLRCWALPESGHEARRRQGVRRRNARYWRQMGSKTAYLREQKRIRERAGQLSDRARELLRNQARDRAEGSYN